MSQPDKRSWTVQVDFYKPSGKWYAGGRVELFANPWDSKEEILAALWVAQSHVIGIRGRDFTIVIDDLPESKADPNYRTCWKMVLQIGKE